MNDFFVEQMLFLGCTPNMSVILSAQNDCFTNRNHHQWNCAKVQRSLIANNDEC